MLEALLSSYDERLLSRLYLHIRANITTYVIIFCLVVPGTMVAQSSIEERPRISADLAHFSTSHKLVQDVYFSFPSPASGIFRFECFRYLSDKDSILVYGKKSTRLNISGGAIIRSVIFGYNDSGSYVHPDFFHILKAHRLVPAGQYHWYGHFVPDSASVVSVQINMLVDSVLPATSALSKGLRSELAGKGGNQMGRLSAAIPASKVPAVQAVDQAAGRIGAVTRSRGLESRIVNRSQETDVQLWYKNWFVGAYRVESGNPIGRQLEQQQAVLGGNISSLAATGLESYRSLMSQVRELARGDKQEAELQGEIAVAGSWSNGQPEYSAQDNNYYEVRARTETEVAEIPVSLEGYYTTQDAHRRIKSSYVRFHYDAEKAKEKLSKLIDGYKRKYNETVAQGAGLGQVYGSYLSGVESKKAALTASLMKETGLMVSGGAGSFGIDTAGLRRQIESNVREQLGDTAALIDAGASKLDSAGHIRDAATRGARIADSAARLYESVLRRLEQIRQLEAQYDKYNRLLDQYRTTSYFDSALAYSKVQDLKNGNGATYKQLAKSAAGLLPEGKVKKAVTGLTSFDAGIFPKYVSKYTIAGQQLKGLDLGYDIGFARIGLSAGQTEFAGRDGGLDKFASYSGRVEFSPGKEQQAQLVYYGYTPSRSLITGDDTFSKAIDLALPTFRQPVHIVSAQYAGTFFRNIRLEGEAATSFRNGDKQRFVSGFNADRLAWNVAAEGHIPGSPLDFIASYEHGGKNFENSTMPLMIAGCDLIKAGIKGGFFKELLSGKVEFNRMTQTNLRGTGGNSRWGFELATHSKQYPSLSVSYKPFATFRTVYDTLGIPQRPLLGEVWTGRATYQIRRSHGVSYRFSAVFNRSTSQIDSLAYGADLLQFNASYANRIWMLSLSGGRSVLNNAMGGAQAADTVNAAHLATTFLMTSCAYSLKSGVSLSGGVDIGKAFYGLSRWGVNAGCAYALSALPIRLRTAVRYGGYRLPAYSGAVSYERLEGTGAAPAMSWRQLISGSLELAWTFKQRVNH